MPQLLKILDEPREIQKGVNEKQKSESERPSSLKFGRQGYIALIIQKIFEMQSGPIQMSKISSGIVNKLSS